MHASVASSSSLRVVFCWAEASPYSAECWRELAARPGVDLHVIHPERLLDRPNPFWTENLLDGISHERFDTSRPDVGAYLLDAVVARRPDVVVLCGWVYWPYTKLVNAPALASARFILGMDSPWRATLVQRLARWRLGHVAARLALVVTASERSNEYARRIGVPDSRLRSGFYGFDYRKFAAAGAARPAPWPRQFLFAGRYAREKSLDVLLAAYARYRTRVSDPWGLSCCGAGPEEHLLSQAEGVENLGFVAPANLPAVFGRHGAFVLPSRFEPWGVVIAEAAAAALPIVCSSACGAAPDLVRSYYNGVTVTADDVEGFTRALCWIHDHEHEMATIGGRGLPLAAAFSAEAWAERWHNYLIEAVERAGEA